MRKHLRHTLLSLLFLLSLSFSLMAEDKPGPLYEDYNNAQQWAEPRLQYTRFSETGELNVWSSKTDGTDERMVFAFKNFNSKYDYTVPYTPVRSPNNRYLIVMIDRQKGNYTFQVIVNLVDQTYKIIDDARGSQRHNWSTDSKRVFFYSDRYAKMHDLDSGKNKYLPLNAERVVGLPDNVIYDRTFLLKDQKTLLTILPFELEMFDINTGKEVADRISLKSVLDLSPVGSRQITDADLSPDQKHLYFRNIYGTGVFDLETAKPLYFTLDSDQPEEWYMHQAIFINNKELLYKYKKSLYTVNIFTQKRTRIAHSYFNGSRITLINKQKIK